MKAQINKLLKKTNDQVFKASGAQHRYAFVRARKGDKASELSISKEIGVAAETISRWKNINGYNEWLEETIAKFRTPIHELLEQVALERLDDFKYWEAIAKRYGYLTDKPVDPNPNDPNSIDKKLVPSMTKEMAEKLLSELMASHNKEQKQS